MRPLLFAATLTLLAASTATAQRATVDRHTVYTDVDGRVITKEEYKAKLRTGQFAVDKAQASGKSYTSISLKPAGAPDTPRPASPPSTYRAARSAPKACAARSSCSISGLSTAPTASRKCPPSSV